MNLAETMAAKEQETILQSDHDVEAIQSRIDCRDEARREAKLAVGRYAWTLLPWFLFLNVLLSLIVIAAYEHYVASWHPTTQEVETMIEARVPPQSILDRLDRIEEKTLKTEGKIEVLTEPDSPLLRSGRNERYPQHGN